ncbi:MAG: 4Fe-4S dicluster-binding protein [Acidimicrobiia bacterium]
MAPGTRLSVATGRAERLVTRQRNPKWKSDPLRIDMSICINCDVCLRACPPQFGAIFNYGVDVVIVPELCSGCDKCLPVCPVDCIVPDPEWTSSPSEWWALAGGPEDPYV